MKDHFIRRTSEEQGMGASVTATDPIFNDIPQRIMVNISSGLFSSHAHLNLKQIEELFDALGEALDWVRDAPYRKAERDAALDAAHPVAEETGSPERGEFDARTQLERVCPLPDFIKGAI